MYRPEPVYFEFTEFKGNARRDYWLGICLEILRVQWFIRKYNFKGIQRSEILARAILGIFRYRAIKEAFQVFSSQYKTLLIFNLAESLPGGDMVLEALYRRVSRITTDVQSDVSSVQYMKWPSNLSPVSLILLEHFGLNLETSTNMGEEMTIVGDFCVGETSPLEIALKQSILDTDRAEAAQATVEQVKVEGIDTNVAVMKVSRDTFHSSLTFVFVSVVTILTNNLIVGTITPFHQTSLAHKTLSILARAL